MKSYFKIAWRNMWRNKRRTIITAASIFFAVFFALVMRSFQIGTYDKMEHDVVTAYTGYIQIHKQGYWDDKVINNIFEENKELQDKISGIENIKTSVPRLESFALASAEDRTKGTLVIGTDPEKEASLTNLNKKLVEGEYLSSNDKDVLVAENLASYLNLQLGDTIVLIGQGYHGMSAAGKYRIKGILHFPTPDLNGRVLYMSITEAQEFYSAYGMLTAYAFDINDEDLVSETSNDIKMLIGEEYEVMSWKEMLTELVQQIQTDNVGGIIMLLILYLIVGFGIIGTIIMMMAERTKEFGVMVAVGMKKSKLSIILFIETIFIGILGILSGIVASMPIILYYFFNPVKLEGEMANMMLQMGVEPVMPFALDIGIFINQALVIFILVLISYVYPFFKIRNLKAITAMRQ